MALFKLPSPLQQFQRTGTLFKFFEGMLLMYILNLHFSLAALVSAEMGLPLNQNLIYFASLFLGYPIVVLTIAIVKIIATFYGVMIDWFFALLLERIGMPAPSIGSAMASGLITLVDAITQVHNDFVEAFWVDNS